MLKVKQKKSEISAKVMKEIVKDNDTVAFYMRMPRPLRKKLRRISSEHDYSMAEWIIEQIKKA